jgi:hypothetical protein
MTAVTLGTALHVLGLLILAGATTAIAGFLYRVRVRRALPDGATLILGLGVVALYLNTRSLFVQFVQGGVTAPTAGEALLNLGVFAATVVVSLAGRRAGDRLGQSDRLTWGWLARDLSPIVRAGGRHISVTLPQEIADLDGYEPVPAETKAALAGRTLDFPRGLTVEELSSQLEARLTETFEVGFVDVDLEPDGTVTYLGLAARPVGLGHTLSPGEAAVALRADPPFSGTAGDTVQLWDTSEGPTRIGTAEFRARSEDVVTVAADRGLAAAIDPEKTYRLVTLPAGPRADREFAAMVRRQAETMRTLAVTADSPLVGSSIAAIAVTTLAVRRASGDLVPIPDRTTVLAAGDVLYVLGRPETLRQLEATAGIEPVDATAELEERAS